MSDKETFDVIVIGSGPGGYVAAIRAAQLGFKTLCVEKGSLGGTCLNVGCIPSKTLLHSSEVYYKTLNETSGLGIDVSGLSYSFEKMMDHKEKTIISLQQGISGLFKKNKITLLQGVASFIDANHIEVIDQEGTKKIYSGKNFIIATGSNSVALPFAPFDEKTIVSSTGALALKKVPSKMLVIGAGVIGCELGSVYQRLGSKVTFVEFMGRICPTLDSSLSQGLQKILEKQGMTFMLSTKVTSISKKEGGIIATVESNDGTKKQIDADVALVSVGRRPNTEGLNIENAGVSLDAKGFIPTDRSFRTKQPHIFAIGDVITGPMLAHKASEEGVAVAEIIAGKTYSVDYISVPNVVYTYPEIGSAGLSEEEAKTFGRDVSVGLFSFNACPRAKCNKETDGFVKIVMDKKSGKLLGIHILGDRAGEMIAEGCVALKQRMTAEELGEVCHAHPSVSESIKEACLAACHKAIHK